MSDNSSQVTSTTIPMVTFTINGKSISVPKGWTVMQAATREGIKIPHFCWHPGLSVAGVCRFCMVKVEGRPKLEIACNLVATDNMTVSTETEEVKEAHKWALEFHLVNHPLDCPICDQAGECGLQDYYMSVGKYQSEMRRPKVLKPKVLDVGGDLVLDTERCILCSRCVRFEEEITKTSALGIFDRGDRAIVGIYEDRKINHNYTTNLVDICPVGAFTSKDFRFKQRVWFLKDKETTCPGCSTGCQIKLYGKPEQRRFYRIKPRYSEINSYWMCDHGRKMYLHLNPEERQTSGWLSDGAGTAKRRASVGEVLKSLSGALTKTPANQIALLVSPQYTLEELDAFFQYFVKERGIKQVYQWRDPSEKRQDFDGMLLRGDRNANTLGLQKVMEKYGLTPEIKSQGFADCLSSKPQLIIALAPEISEGNQSLTQQLTLLAKEPKVSLWTSLASVHQLDGFISILPMKTFAEKEGHFINYEGKEGALSQPFPALNDDVKDVNEVILLLKSSK